MVVAVVGVGAGVLTFLQLVIWAMATSHPGLAGDVAIRQRLVATSCSGIATLVVVASGFRRRLSAARLWYLLACAGASLACGFVLVSRDARQWDLASVALAGLTIALLVFAAWLLLAPARPLAAAERDARSDEQQYR